MFLQFFSIFFFNSALSSKHVSKARLGVTSTSTSTKTGKAQVIIITNDGGWMTVGEWVDEWMVSVEAVKL